MPINLANGTRPVANPTTPLTVQLDIKPAIEDDINDSVLYPITLNDRTFVPPNFTVANCSYTNTQTTVTTTATGGFANVRKGDGVSASGSNASHFPANIHVISKTVDNTQITLSAPVAGTSTNETLTFTPYVPTSGGTDLVVAYLRVQFQQSAQTMTMVVSVLPVPGTLVSDADRDGDTSDDVPLTSLTPLPNIISVSIDLDEYLTQARVARS